LNRRTDTSMKFVSHRPDVPILTCRSYHIEPSYWY